MDDDRKFVGMRKGLVRERGKNVIKKMKYVNKDRLELNVIGIRPSRYVYLKYGKMNEIYLLYEPNISWKLLRKKQYKLKENSIQLD